MNQTVKRIAIAWFNECKKSLQNTLNRKSNHIIQSLDYYYQGECSKLVITMVKRGEKVYPIKEMTCHHISDYRSNVIKFPYGNEVESRLLEAWLSDHNKSGSASIKLNNYEDGSGIAEVVESSEIGRELIPLWDKVVADWRTTRENVLNDLFNCFLKDRYLV